MIPDIVIPCLNHNQYCKVVDYLEASKKTELKDRREEYGDHWNEPSYLGPVLVLNSVGGVNITNRYSQEDIRSGKFNHETAITYTDVKITRGGAIPNDASSEREKQEAVNGLIKLVGEF